MKRQAVFLEDELIKELRELFKSPDGSTHGAMQHALVRGAVLALAERRSQIDAALKLRDGSTVLIQTKHGNGDKEQAPGTGTGTLGGNLANNEDIGYYSLHVTKAAEKVSAAVKTLKEAEEELQAATKEGKQPSVISPSVPPVSRSQAAEDEIRRFNRNAERFSKNEENPGRGGKRGDNDVPGKRAG